jgi:DNA repair exonuclease SbcCD ATPase subunit
MEIPTSQLDSLKSWFDGQMAKLDYITSSLKEREEALEKENAHLDLLLVARDKISEIGVVVQERIKGYVEEVMTEGLREVLGSSFSFKIDFQVNRNKPEVFLYVCKDGEEYSPAGDELGGGVLDITSFLFRLVIDALSNRSRNKAVFILDEPFKFLGKEHFGGISKLLLRLVKDLNIQFIMVTHEEELAELADKCWVCYQVNGESIVEEI